MFKFISLLFLATNSIHSFTFPRVSRSLKMSTTVRNQLTDYVLLSDKYKGSKEPPKEGLSRIVDFLEKADKEPEKSNKPPIYEPGPYPYKLLSALPYFVPIADAFDLGKYMFEAYPQTAEVYNTLFGAIAGVYNGVPFLPFAIFFLLSYIARAPTFPVEVRFHTAQAFMLSIVQFLPSILFGFLEKASVPGMGVLYNTRNLFMLLIN